MEISKNLNGETLTFALEGRLDTVTAPALENELKDIGDITLLIIDLEKLEYISSAGLRVMLMAQKLMSAKGEMKVTNVCDAVREVFEITGFADILNIE